jgi:pantoate kinase
VEYLCLGDLSTAEVLSGDTERLSAAGEAALSQLVAEPTMATFMAAAREFSREAGLLTDSVREVVTDVNEVGGEATMAMLGETVVALGSGLSDAGYDPRVTRIDPTGATLEEPLG